MNPLTNQGDPCDGSMDYEEAKRQMDLQEPEPDKLNITDIQSSPTYNIDKPQVINKLDDDINSHSNFCLKNPNDKNDILCIDYDNLKSLYELKNMSNIGPEGPPGPKGDVGPMGPTRKAQKYNYKKMENSMIEGENTMKLSYISPNECSSICDKAEWCKSFDYNQEYNSCNLSSANLETSILKPSSQYNYYEKGEIN